MDEKVLIANHLVPDNEVWVSPKTFENQFSNNVAEALKPSHNTASDAIPLWAVRTWLRRNVNTNLADVERKIVEMVSIAQQHA